MRFRKISGCILLVGAYLVCVTRASPVQAKGYESTRTFHSSSNTFGLKTASKPATVTQTGHFSEVITTNAHVQANNEKPLTQNQVSSHHGDEAAPTQDKISDHSSDDEVLGLLPADPSRQAQLNYGTRIQAQDKCSVQGNCDSSASSHTGQFHDSSNNQFPVQQNEEQVQDHSSNQHFQDQHKEQVPSSNQQFPFQQNEQVPSSNQQFPFQQNEQVPSSNQQFPFQQEEQVPSSNQQFPFQQNEQISSSNQEFPFQQNEQISSSNQEFPFQQNEQVPSSNQRLPFQPTQDQFHSQDQGPTQQKDKIDQLVDELDQDIRDTFGDDFAGDNDQYTNAFQEAGPRTLDAEPDIPLLTPEFPIEDNNDQQNFQAERLPVASFPEEDAGAMKGDDGQYDFPDQQNPDFFSHMEPEVRSDVDQTSNDFFQPQLFGDTAVNQFDQFRGDAGDQSGFQRFVPERTISNNKGTYYQGEGRESESFYQNRDPIEVLRYNVPGSPGDDYPIFYQVPDTSFDCNQQPFSAGIYGDTDAKCQVFHFCRENGGRDSFLCPNGTVFNQQFFVCDWWYNYNCSDTPSFYNLNAQLYWDLDSLAPSQIMSGLEDSPDQPVGDDFVGDFQQDFGQVSNTRFPQAYNDDGRPDQVFGAVGENVVFPQGRGTSSTQEVDGNRVVSGQTSYEEKRVDSTNGDSRTSTSSTRISSTQRDRSSFPLQRMDSHSGTSGEHVPSSHQPGHVDTQKPVEQTNFNQRPVTQTTGFQKPVEQTNFNQRPVTQTTGFQKPVEQTNFNQRPVTQTTGFQKPVEQANFNQRTVTQTTGFQKPVEQTNFNQRPVTQTTGFQKPQEQTSFPQTDSQTPAVRTNFNQRTVTQTTGFQKPAGQQTTSFNQRTVTQTQSGFQRPVEQTSFDQRPISQVSETQKPQTQTSFQQDTVPQNTGFTQEQISFVDDNINSQDFQTSFEDDFNQAPNENTGRVQSNTGDEYSNVDSNQEIQCDPDDSSHSQSHGASPDQSYFQQQQVVNEQPSISVKDDSGSFGSNFETAKKVSTSFESNQYPQDFSQVSDSPFDVQQQNVDFSLDEGNLTPDQGFISAKDFSQTTPAVFDSQFFDNQQVNLDAGLENPFFPDQGHSVVPFEVTSLFDDRNPLQQDLSVDEKRPKVSATNDQVQEKFSQDNVVLDFKPDTGSQGEHSLSFVSSNTNLPAQEQFDVSSVSQDKVDIKNIVEGFNSRNVAFQESTPSPIRKEETKENLPYSQTTNKNEADIVQENVEAVSFPQEEEIKTAGVHDKQNIPVFQQQNIQLDDIFHMMRGLPGVSTQQRFLNQQQPNNQQRLSFRPYGQNISPNLNYNNQNVSNNNAPKIENQEFSQYSPQGGNPNSGHLNYRPYGQNTSPQGSQSNVVQGQTNVVSNQGVQAGRNQNVPQDQPQQNIEKLVFPDAQQKEERKRNLWQPKQQTQNVNSQDFSGQPVQTFVEQHERRVNPNDQVQFFNRQEQNGAVSENQNTHQKTNQDVQSQAQQNINDGHNNQNGFAAGSENPRIQNQVNTDIPNNQVFQQNSRAKGFNPNTQPQIFVANQDQVHQGGFQNQIHDGRQPGNGNFQPNSNTVHQNPNFNGNQFLQEQNVQFIPGRNQNVQFDQRPFQQDQILEFLPQVGQIEPFGQGRVPLIPRPQDQGQFEIRPVLENARNSNVRVYSSVKGYQGNARESRNIQHFGQLGGQPHTQRIEPSDVRVYSQNDPTSAASVLSYNGWRPIVPQ